MSMHNKRRIKKASSMRRITQSALSKKQAFFVRLVPSIITCAKEEARKYGIRCKILPSGTMALSIQRAGAAMTDMHLQRAYTAIVHCIDGALCESTFRHTKQLSVAEMHRIEQLRSSQIIATILADSSSDDDTCPEKTLSKLWIRTNVQRKLLVVLTSHEHKDVAIQAVGKLLAWARLDLVKCGTCRTHVHAKTTHEGCCSQRHCKENCFELYTASLLPMPEYRHDLVPSCLSRKTKQHSRSETKCVTLRTVSSGTDRECPHCASRQPIHAATQQRCVVMQCTNCTYYFCVECDAPYYTSRGCHDHAIQRHRENSTCGVTHNEAVILSLQYN